MTRKSNITPRRSKSETTAGSPGLDLFNSSMSPVKARPSLDKKPALQSESQTTLDFLKAREGSSKNGAKESNVGDTFNTKGQAALSFLQQRSSARHKSTSGLSARHATSARRRVSQAGDQSVSTDESLFDILRRARQARPADSSAAIAVVIPALKAINLSDTIANLDSSEATFVRNLLAVCLTLLKAGSNNETDSAHYTSAATYNSARSVRHARSARHQVGNVRHQASNSSSMDKF